MVKAEKSRNVQMDLLRVVACLMVVVIHVVADGINIQDVRTLQSAALMFYGNICRAAVPLFFMFSGMFSRSTDWKKSLKKAFSLLIVFIATTALYCAVDVYANHYIYCWDTRSLIHSFLEDFPTFKYHLWFLPIYITLLVWSPAINELIGKSREMLHYLTVIFLIGTIGVQSLRVVFYDQPVVLQRINYIPDLSMNYVGYYIFGRFMCEYKAWFRRWRKVFCSLGVISLALVYIGTRKISLFENKSSELLYDHLWILILLEAIAWVVLFDGFKIPPQWHGTIAWLKKQSLFIYLSHVMVIDVMNWYGLSARSIHPIWGVPLKTAAVFTVCCILCSIKTLVLNGLGKCRVEKI